MYACMDILSEEFHPMIVRSIQQVIPGQPTTDGDGVKISRVAMVRTSAASPFLMLDEFRSDDQKDYIGGFPPHPHRGFETLTYLRAGGFTHEDHMGNKETIKSGGAQWMSAASGIIHSEMPSLELDQLHGFQLWINLPAEKKMNPPQYRDVESDEMAIVESAGAQARIIAGDVVVDGQAYSGPLDRVSSKARVADVRLVPDGECIIALPDDLNVLAYIYDGSLVGVRKVEKRHLIIYGPGETVELCGGPDGAGVLLLAGMGIDEPVANYGPFVMNTQAEIEQAIRDYQQGVLVQG
jgi:redox-sensitive bicupin YhaK (pirin superfamily)